VENPAPELIDNKISPQYIAHAKQAFLVESEVKEFIAACSRPLRKSIRINTLRITVSDFHKIAVKYQLKLIPIPWCEEGFWLESNSTVQAQSNFDLDNDALGNLPEHIQGLFYIQEASSMLPPIALLKDESIDEQNENRMLLDFAAAPGSKTTQLAAQVKNTGLILANEISASRVKVLHSNLVRCGVTNTCMSQFDGRKLGERLSGLFDYVLLDAPCGGEGTVRKDPSALVNWQLAKVEEIAKLQKQLILKAYQCLKPGGKLVYSTCTLSPEENQQVAEYLIEQSDATIVSLKGLFEGAEKSLTKEGFLHVLPHVYDSEGFFVSAFRKPNNSLITYFDGNISSPFKSISRNQLKQVENYYLSHFGLKFSNLGFLIKQRDKEIWLFPKPFEAISSLVRLNRSGIKLAEIYPNKIRSTHEFAVCFANQINLQKTELNHQQAEDFFKGRDISIEDTSIINGEVILMFNGYPIGLGRNQKNKIKNMLPRDLVKDQIRIKGHVKMKESF